MRLHAKEVRGLTGAVRSPIFQGRFGRIFRGLPAASFGSDERGNLENLKALARAMVAAPEPEGPKDGKDTEESGIPSLYTYFGQFIDHDLTFDPVSSLQRQNDPNALTDFRSPAFDLDCVYGRGPDDQPYLYAADNRFLLGNPLTGGAPNGAKARDLPRAQNRRAIIGDPRNDENAIVSQLQGLFLKFHNLKVVEPGKSFEQVQQLVRFHYQYVILNDFLPRIVHADVLDALKTNGKFDDGKLKIYHWRNNPFMPVEFSAAAYRFGHSMVRPGYRINDAHLLSIFPGLVGFQAVQRGRGLDWGRFIDIDTRSDFDDENRLQLAYRIDTSLVDPLGNLPPQVAVNPSSLAERNLQRGWRLGLPSGQDVARAMGVTPLKDEQILLGKAEDAPQDPLIDILHVPGVAREVFEDNCPLWTYILAEAMHFRVPVRIPVTEPNRRVNTPQLGPVGGRIVAEVFLGLMFGDEKSLLNLDRNWTPPGNPGYKLKDFVKFALGV
jgi:hypothetical protein